MFVRVRGQELRFTTLINSFNLAVCGVILAVSYTQGTVRSIVFNFGVFTLLVLSLFLRRKREFINIPLALFLLWSIASIFIHVKLATTGVVFEYLNIYLMANGFIYLLSAVLLYKLVIEYSDSLIPYILTFCVALIPYASRAIHGGRVTIIFAFLLANIIWLWKRKRLYSVWLMVYTLLAAVCNYKWIMMKWGCRPVVWGELARKALEHPFIGSGFKHMIGMPESMIYVPTSRYGIVFKHNDYLAIGGSLGIVATILLVWFVIGEILKVKNYGAVLLMTMAITPMFQCTMYNLYTATLFLVVGALITRRSYECNSMGSKSLAGHSKCCGLHNSFGFYHS